MSGETTGYDYQGEWGRPPGTTTRVSGETTEYDYQGEWEDHRVPRLLYYKVFFSGEIGPPALRHTGKSFTAL